MAKEENQDTAKVSPTMFSLRPHRLLPYRISHNNKFITLQQHQAQVMVSLHVQRENEHVWMFWQPPMKSKSTWDALVEEDKTMWWSGTAKQKRIQEISCLGWRSWHTSVYNDDQHQCPEKLVYNMVRLHGSRWQKFTYGYSEKTEIPSHSECSEEIEESDEQKSAFSFHTIQPDLACENGSALFCTTNCLYPGPWMHKSYGPSTGSWSFLQLCWLTSQQWTLVGNSANKFEILLCKFPTIQVHWETCDIHVWQWMEHSVHRIRHCPSRSKFVANESNTNSEFCPLSAWMSDFGDPISSVYFVIRSTVFHLTRISESCNSNVWGRIFHTGRALCCDRPCFAHHCREK